MATSKEKALAAFHAMRALGIPAETIKPKLKELLKLYANDWSLIERNNYGSLADFIFESQEEEETHKEVKGEDVDAPFSNPLVGQERLSLKRPKPEKMEGMSGGGGGEGKWLLSGECGSSKGEISGSKRLYEEFGGVAQDFEIASSELGEVSLQLGFPFVPPNFHMPNMDAVFKKMQDKYIESYKISDPNFCIKKVMKDLCESYLKAGRDT